MDPVETETDAAEAPGPADSGASSEASGEADASPGRADVPAASPLDRRTFLTRSAAGAGALAALSTGACAPGDSLPGAEEGTGQAGAGATSGAAEASVAAPPSFELEEVSLADLRRRMEDGSMTSVRATELYLERIEAANLQGPVLRAVIETNPDALRLPRSGTGSGRRGASGGRSTECRSC